MAAILPALSAMAASAAAGPLYPAWTKLLDLTKELRLADFPLSKHFTHVADIVPDTATTRQTVIEFRPTIPRDRWRKETTEWIYMFTINGHIVKIGGTRSGLAGRCGSYLCGHHIAERGKSRDCSKTNGFIYNTFDHYARNGHTIQMWAHELKPALVTVDIWGTPKEVQAQVYTALETTALETYKATAGHYPALSDNSDPSHRAKKSAKAAV